MSSLKKEYTRTIQNIWQAFYDHDEKRIGQIKKEIILRLNKYCEFYNHFGGDTNSDYMDDDGKIFERLANYYNIPETVWNPMHYGSKIPKKRIHIYERYIKNNFCKGIPAKKDDYDLPYGKAPIGYMDDFDDLDLLYIFFGVPLNAKFDWPKSFYYFGRGMRYFQVLYHIEDRTNWKEGFTEEHWNNGNLRASGSYVNGFPHGIWKFQSPDGKKHQLAEWEDGCLNGIRYPDYSDDWFGIEISKNGHYLLSSEEHHNDIGDITKKLVLESDICLVHINMLNHPYKKSKKKKHGKFKVGNGDWYFEGEYNNNIPVGIWREYLDNKLIYELAYKDGEIDLENSIFRYKRTGTPIPWNKLK